MAYIQCKLTKIDTYQVAYIPEKFAKAGKIVKIKQDDGWDDGWCVSEIYLSSKTDKEPNVVQAVKKHRKRTGDSLKK